MRVCASVYASPLCGCGADGMTTPSLFSEKITRIQEEHSNFLKKVQNISLPSPTRCTNHKHTQTGSNGSGYQLTVKLLIAFGFIFEDKFIAFAYGDEVNSFLILGRVGVYYVLYVR